MKAVFTFAVLMGLFYGLTHMARGGDVVFQPYLAALARAIAAILRALGYDASAAGTTVTYPDFSMQIVRGCDAIEPLATFVAAVLASPARFLLKLPGIIVGAVAIAGVNLVRLVSLFLVGVHYRPYFDVIHEGVWQAILVGLAIVFWASWIQWATRGERRRLDPEAPSSG